MSGSTLASCKSVANECRKLLGHVASAKAGILATRMKDRRMRSALTAPASRQTAQAIPAFALADRGSCPAAARPGRSGAPGLGHALPVRAGQWRQVGDKLFPQEDRAGQARADDCRSTATSSSTSGMDRSRRVLIRQPRSGLSRMCIQPPSRSRSSTRGGSTRRAGRRSWPA